MNSTDLKIKEQTINWIKSVVIDCNFCPFAAKAILKKSIRYIIKSNVTLDESLEALKEELNYLETDTDIETSFIIFENNFSDFDDYLDLVKRAEQLLNEDDFDGIYQIASFHPNYCFEGSDNDDAANYTNRSIYPMLHLLREESIEKVLEKYADPESIPERNIRFAHEKGLEYMRKLRETCKEI